MCPTPVGGYPGNVPSVTTIIGATMPKHALVNWAYECGLRGEDYIATRDKAGSIGTVAHAMVEAHAGNLPTIHMLDGLSAEDATKVNNAFGGYVAWRKKYPDIKILLTEIRLVSQRHKFGGTIDATAIRDNFGRLLLDWKTANGTWIDHIIQLAAYKELWAENYPGEAFNECRLIRLDKDEEKFEEFIYTGDQLDVHWRTFLRLRDQYEDNKLINKELNARKRAAQKALAEQLLSA